MQTDEPTDDPADRRVLDQLSRYGDWYRNKRASADANGTAAPQRVEVPVTPAPASGPRWRWAVAATAVLVIATAAVVIVRDRSDVADRPVEISSSGGGLFLLPPDGWEVVNANLSRSDARGTEWELPLAGATFGHPVPGGYIHLMSAAVYSEDPANRFEELGADERPIRNGTIVEAGWGTIAFVEVDDFWLSVTTAPGTEWLRSAVRDLDVDGEGRVSIGTSSRFEVIPGTEFNVDWDDDGEYVSTYADLAGPGGNGLVLETVNRPALLGFLWFAWAGEMTVRGTDGFYAVDYVTAGETRGALIWPETPGTVAFLSGDASLGELLAVADGLEVVDEDTWLEATGAVIHPVVSSESPEEVPSDVMEILTDRPPLDDPGCEVDLDNVQLVSTIEDPGGGVDYTVWAAAAGGNGRFVLGQFSPEGHRLGGAMSSCSGPSRPDTVRLVGSLGSPEVATHVGRAPDEAATVLVHFGEDEPLVAEVQAFGYFLFTSDAGEPDLLEALDADGEVLGSGPPWPSSGPEVCDPDAGSASEPVDTDAVEIESSADGACLFHPADE